MSQETKLFPSPDWTTATANQLVRGLESQYLAMLAQEYLEEVYDGDDLQADDIHQQRLNEEYRLAHPTEPNSNDVQSFYDLGNEEDFSDT